MKNRTDFFAGLCILMFSGMGLLGLMDLPPAHHGDFIGSSGFPKLVLGLLILLTAILIKKSFTIAPLKDFWAQSQAIKQTCRYFFTFCCYLLSITVLADIFESMADSLPFQYNGAFSVSTFLFLVVSLYQLGRRKPMEIIAVAFCTTSLLVLIFSSFFQVMLP